MKNTLPDWARLHPDLNKRQRFTAITLLVIGTLVTILSLIVIFALADLGRPSFLPWIIWFIFGVGPIVTAMEEYGAEREFEAKEVLEVHSFEETGPLAMEALAGRPTPPRLRLIRSPEFPADIPYDQEKDQGSHGRRTAI